MVDFPRSEPSETLETRLLDPSTLNLLPALTPEVFEVYGSWYKVEMNGVGVCYRSAVRKESVLDTEGELARVVEVYYAPFTHKQAEMTQNDKQAIKDKLLKLTTITAQVWQIKYENVLTLLQPAPEWMQHELALE